MQHDNDNGQALRFLSVCSGIEAASVAWPQWQAVGYAEIEPFPAFVLHHHYGAGRPKFMPDPGENQLKKKDKDARLAAIRSVSKLPVDGNVTNWGDFTKIDTSMLGRVDILCGGTPCQAFSVAGLRGGLDDARGNLTLKFVELAHELAAGNGLRNVVWENVVGVLSDKGNAFGCFLGGLVGADAAIDPCGKWPSHGMVAGPKARAAWAVKDGQFFGVAQRRRRVIVVADFGIGADPAAVLFEPESLPRHSAPSREKGEGVAPTISARTKGGGGLGTDFDLDGGLVHAPEIARCVATREGSSQDYETTTMVAQSVAFDWYASQSQSMPVGEIAPPLKTTMQPAVSVAIRGREGGATAELGGEVATALRASQGGGDEPHVLAFAQNTRDEVRFLNGDGQIAGALAAEPGMKQQTYLLTSAVRRLTPVECERLQGFPDNYTAIPWRGKPADQCPDGPRYKALGNSWAVPLFTWLGRRIDMHMPRTPANDNDNKEAARAA